MEQQDYDCRTALHIAAAEGDSLSSTHTFLTFSALTVEQKSMRYQTEDTGFCLSGQVEAVIFLTEICKVNPNLKDRYPSDAIKKEIHLTNH